MNIVPSPRLARQCHGMLRDDRTVGLWCDRLIRVGYSATLLWHAVTKAMQCGRGGGGGSQLAFLQRSLRMRGCTWQTRKGEQMNRRHEQGMEPRCWLGWVRFKVEEGGNKEGKTRGRNHEWRVLPLVNLSRQAAQALIWLPTWFRWNFTAEYFTRMISA